MMKKSLLALSVAAAAMGAQAADVQVYGLIDTSLSFVSSDADIAGHDRVNSFSMENAKEFGSRFGLKGSEDLGNGYKVAFVLESGIKSDDGSLDQGGKLFGREAHVDLVGPFGKLSAGLMPVFGSTGGVEGHGGESDRYASLAARYKAGALEAVLVADTTMYGTYRTDTAASKDDGWTVTFGGNYTFDGGVKVLAFTQFFGDQELKARPRAGVGFDGINAVAGDYGFVDGYGVSLGVNVPAMGGVAKAQVAYRDMDNKDNVDFKRVIAALGYDYALSKRTAVYAMTGWSQEKVENGTTEAKPNGYEFTTGIVHRF